jgi:hypothetical protein
MLPQEGDAPVQMETLYHDVFGGETRVKPDAVRKPLFRAPDHALRPIRLARFRPHASWRQEAASNEVRPHPVVCCLFLAMLFGGRMLWLEAFRASASSSSYGCATSITGCGACSAPGCGLRARPGKGTKISFVIRDN